ncbi:MAG: signal peptidase II [Calditrichia bacterium]
MKLKWHLDSNTFSKVLLIVLIVFVLDQITKWIAFVYLQPHISIPVMGDFFRLTYVENPGMAFGIRIGNRFLFNLLSISAALILILYLFFLYPGQKEFTYSLAFILGGAFGNLFDRLMHGKVIDFFDFDFPNIHISPFSFLGMEFSGYHLERWPVFNIADIAVTTGMFLIFLIILFHPEKELNPSQKSESATENNNSL